MIRALDYESSRPSSNRSRRRRGHCVCLLSMTLGSHSLSTTVYKLVLANCWGKHSHFPLHPDLHIQKVVRETSHQTKWCIAPKLG